MGKIAESGVQYCGGSSGASMSVNGQIISTDNPPISYVQSGEFILVSDATGEIAKLTPKGKLTLVSSVAAAEGVNYCGTAIAELVWDSGAKRTNQAPIRYTLTPGAPDQWDYVFFGFGSSSGCKTFYTPIYRQLVDVTPSIEVIIDRSGLTSSCDPAGGAFKADAKVSFTGGSSSLYLSGFGVIPPVNTFFDPNTIDDIYWHFSLPSLFSKTLIKGSGWVLKIFNATGEIFSAEYAERPTNFIANCYDFVAEPTIVSVACKGECPSDAEYQCQCGTNLYCYGYDDPVNPTRFEVKYTTQTA